MKKISQQGLDLIKKFEGLKLDVYKDVAGLLTVGYGHLIKSDECLRLGDTITLEQAEILLKQDVRTAESIVNIVCPDIKQHQFDALVSFAYNVGNTAFANSTLAKHVKHDRIEEAAKQFSRWVRAGGKIIQGLVNRRAAEAELFLGR